jgi:hypothetical protein
MTRRHRVCRVLAILLAIAPVVRAQSDEPRSFTPRVAFGIVGDLHTTLSHGSFTATCDCPYGDGASLSYAVGLRAEWALGRRGGLAAALLVQDLSTLYSVTEWRREYIANLGTYSDVLFERTADVSARYLTLQAHGVWYTGLGALGVFGGPSIGIPLKAHLKETETILINNWTYASGASEKVFADEDLATLYGATPLRVAVDAGIEYPLPVSVQTTIMPFVIAEFPLTTVAEGSGAWRIGLLGAGIMLAVRY